jgi:tetratricopeptide (TPR) repeat protein
LALGAELLYDAAMRRLGGRLGAILILIVLAAGGARAQENEPPAFGSDENGTRYLFIPGVGKIPLPPGVRGFGPADPDDPSDSVAPKPFGLQPLGPKASAPRPAPPLSPEERQAQEMDRLLARLAAAEDEREAQSISAAILLRWSRSGSDTVDLLAARALAAEVAGAPALAKALLDYTVALSPNWPDGFVRRARVMALEGDVAGALADLETATRLEPKRFDALEALGMLAEKAGDKKRALGAFRKALGVSPRNEAVHKNEERLRTEVEGRDI